MVSYPVIMRITTRQTLDPPKTSAAEPRQSEWVSVQNQKVFYPRKVNNETKPGPTHGIMIHNIILTLFPLKWISLLFGLTRAREGKGKWMDRSLFGDYKQL